MERNLRCVLSIAFSNFMDRADMMTKVLALFLLFTSTTNFAQLSAQPDHQDLSNQIPEEPVYDASIVDERYGILLYEPLNMQLAGDSVRLCDGYACNGWVEDNYEDGTLLHKGYYIDGQLKVYKNYYPNGEMEREFKGIDNYRSSLEKFYPTGELKSKVKYQGGDPLEWTDYFKNGNVEYEEEYDKSMMYHKMKNSYYEDGTPETALTLDHKKKLIFTYFEYYPSGQMKLEGEMQFSESTYDYMRVGKWTYYNESGSVTKEETYDNGNLTKEKTY